MDDNFHLIEKYFQGKLDAEELKFFHQKLQKDAAFEREFRDMKFIREGLKASARQKAQQVLLNAEARLNKKETTKISVSMRRLVSIAASLIVIATVSYFAISGRTGGSMTGEEVFAAYYEPYINLRGPERGEDVKINTLSARAYNAYDIKDYSTSANLFSELLEVEKSAENFLYSGIANLEAGNLEAAKNQLNTVMNNFTELREQAQWYLAMTLLKEGVEDEAVANLAWLSVSKSSYFADANRILTSLNKSLILFDTDGDGDVKEVKLVPPGGGDSPDGNDILEVRQYQIGKLQSFGEQRIIPFWNELPIYGLEEGDLVEFAVIRSKEGSNKDFAIIYNKK